MALANNNNNPDLLYLKSREDLLQYEDARMNSLLQAVADFYSTRNDQSIWGNILRAYAIELAKYDYDYSYDIVNKDPSLLTPPDIRRRWATPLYISGNWPSSTQFDTQYKQMLVQLIAAYKMGTTVAAIEAVIFAYTGIHIQVIELYKLIGNGVYDQSDRNSISVSVNVGGTGSNPLTTVTSLIQLQTIIQSLYNAIALAKPAHVGLEFTTVFGEGEEVDCLISPQFVTQAQYNLLPTVVEQGFFTFLNYVPISPAIFWEPSTVTSNPFDAGTVLRDSNGNFQYTPAAGKPGLTVPVWNTASLGHTTDGGLSWENISPAVLTTAVAANVVTVVLSYQVGLDIGDVVKLINLSSATWLDNVPLTVTSVNGASFSAAYTHTTYSALPETSGTATFALPTPITGIQFNALNSTWKTLYQKFYQNTCAPTTPLQPWFHPGINDTLRIFVRQVEISPQGPMLIVAGSTSTAKTTIAAYGRLLYPQLTPVQWAALPSIFVNIYSAFSDGTNATYFYIPQNQFLHEDEILTIQGFSNPALNVTARIHDVFNLVANINAVALTSNVVTVFAPNSFMIGMLTTLTGLTNASFLNGVSLVITSASPTSFTAAYTHANYAKAADTGTAEVSTFTIPNTGVVAVEQPSPKTNAGLLTPTLQSGYYLSKGQYVLGQPPIAVSGAGIGSSWVPSGVVFQGQIIEDPNGNQQIALNSGTSGAIKPSWSETLNATTNDNGVEWRNVGKNTFSAPNSWVGILNFNVVATPQPFTGEVGNVDPLHLYGLVAPRLNQVWELSGNPQDQDFIFGLF